MGSNTADVISLDDARRRNAAATPRARCEAVLDNGRACRNYASASGYCRVHEPEPAEATAAPADPVQPTPGSIR